MVVHRVCQLRSLSWLALAAAVCIALPVWRGLGTSQANRHLDSRWLYVAGQCWTSGESPYDLDAFAARWESTTGQAYVSPFAYPPHAVVVGAPLALLDWPRATIAFDVLNLGALLVMIGLLVRHAWLQRRPAGRIALACAVAAATASASMVLTLGQMSLLAVAGLVAADHFAGRRRWLAAGVGVFFAALKIHVTGLALFYLAVRRGWGPLAFGAGLTAVACLCGAGPDWGSFISRYAGSLDGYQTVGANRPESLVGLPRLLELLGFENASLLGALLGLLAVLLVLHFVLRESHAPEVERDGNVTSAGLPDFLLVPAVITAAFVPLHIYDLVLLIPVVFAAVLGPWRRLAVLAPGLICVLRPTTVAYLLEPAWNRPAIYLADWVATAGSWYLLITLLLIAGGELHAKSRARREHTVGHAGATDSLAAHSLR